MKRLLFAILLFASFAQAADIKLAWDANTEPDLAGYKVYWGTASRTYGTLVDVHNVTVYTVTGLDASKHYFAVTAYNTSGIESGFSNEVASPISSPTGLKITSQSASLRWFGVVLLAITSENSTAVLRYHKIGDNPKWQTVLATPTPTKMQHRAVLYFPPGQTYYAYEWTVTIPGSDPVTGMGTFQTR